MSCSGKITNELPLIGEDIIIPLETVNKKSIREEKAKNNLNASLKQLNDMVCSNGVGENHILTTEQIVDRCFPDFYKACQAVKKSSKLCSKCNNPARHLCSGCNLVYYCDKNCQNTAWPEHKKTCGK
jgi:hypothetical protein